MAYYLVTARPRADQLNDLTAQLGEAAFVDLRPFGQSLTKGLLGARWQSEGVAIWEEEDYCSPPLAMERAAVLDAYFDDIQVERVERDEGWQRIQDLPRIFPKVADGATDSVGV
ncbi:MAG: hypothetical protein HC802_16125 [Caldilineaceae bacterium]|nr:hypothetical protein [Caldilineaceae bacterium]